MVNKNFNDDKVLSNRLFEGLNKDVLPLDSSKMTMEEAIQSGVFKPGQLYGSSDEKIPTSNNSENASPPQPPKQKFWDTMPGRMAMSSLIMQGMGSAWRGASSVGKEFIDNVGDLVTFSEQEDSEDNSKVKSNNFFQGIQSDSDKEKNSQVVKAHVQHPQVQSTPAQVQQPPVPQRTAASPNNALVGTVPKIAMSALIAQGVGAGIKGLAHYGGEALEHLGGFIGFSEEFPKSVDENFALNPTARAALLTAGTAAIGGAAGYVKHAQSSDIEYRKYVKSCMEKGITPIPRKQFEKDSLVKNVGIGAAAGAGAGALGGVFVNKGIQKTKDSQDIQGALNNTILDSKNGDNIFGGKGAEVRNSLLAIANTPTLNPSIANKIKLGKIDSNVISAISKDKNARAIMDEYGVSNIIKKTSESNSYNTLKDFMTGAANDYIDSEQSKVNSRIHNWQAPARGVAEGVDFVGGRISGTLDRIDGNLRSDGVEYLKNLKATDINKYNELAQRISGGQNPYTVVAGQRIADGASAVGSGIARGASVVGSGIAHGASRFGEKSTAARDAFMYDLFQTNPQLHKQIMDTVRGGASMPDAIRQTLGDTGVNLADWAANTKVGKAAHPFGQFFKGFYRGFSAPSMIAGAAGGGLVGTGLGYLAGTELGNIDYLDEKKLAIVKNLPAPEKEAIIKKWQEKGMLVGGGLGVATGGILGATYKSQEEKNQKHTATKVEEKMREQVIKGYGLPKETKSMIAGLVENGDISPVQGERLFFMAEDFEKEPVPKYNYHHKNTKSEFPKSKSEGNTTFIFQGGRGGGGSYNNQSYSPKEVKISDSSASRLANMLGGIGATT